MGEEEFLTKVRALHGDALGLYFYSLHEFISGSLMLRQGHIVKFPIEINLDLLEGPMRDVRAVMPPFIYDNNMVPMLVFVDQEQLSNSLFGAIPLNKTKKVLLKLKELAKTDDEVRLLLDDINPGWDNHEQ